MTLPTRQLRLYMISSLKSHHNISYTFRKAPAVFLLACSRSSEETPSPSLRPGRRRPSAMRTRPSPTSKTSSRSSAMPWPSTSRSSPSPRRCGGHWLNEDQYFRILEFCVDCNKVAQLFNIYTHYCARASPGSWYIIVSAAQTPYNRPGPGDPERPLRLYCHLLGLVGTLYLYSHSPSPSNLSPSRLTKTS